jgi:hypothetical protein
MEELNDLIGNYKLKIELLKELSKAMNISNSYRLEVKLGCYRSFLQDLELLAKDIEENKL